MNDPFADLDPVGSKKNKFQISTQNYATAPVNQQTFSSTSIKHGNPAAPVAFGSFMPQMRYQDPIMNASNGSYVAQPRVPSAFDHIGNSIYQPAYQSQDMHLAHHFQQQSNSNGSLNIMETFPQVNTQSYMSLSPLQPQSQSIMHDSIKKSMSPVAAVTNASCTDPFATFGMNAVRSVEPTAPSPFATSSACLLNVKPPSNRNMGLKTQSSTVVDFDPFSPTSAVPQFPFEFPSISSAAVAVATEEKSQQRDIFDDDADFAGKGFESSNGNGGKFAAQDSELFDFFSEGSTNALFESQSFTNIDDQVTNDPQSFVSSKRGGTRVDATEADELAEELDSDEYEVFFNEGSKLGLLMERADIWNQETEKRQELAVVKLVVEDGAAEQAGVQTGSVVVGINHKSVAFENYRSILEVICLSSRPLVIRFRRGNPSSQDTSQGAILTRISNGTFSIGNFTAGNARWSQKYYAFGGSKFDVLQLFVSRAAYHECVISLYEKRSIQTEIQSFRLCREHKISPVKNKIYKGYGQLYYFALTVPSLLFVAAKFASEDYDTIKNLWTHCYEAIERKKRVAY